MNLAEVSVKRPIFITCIAFVVIVLGTMSMRRLGVDLFPDISFPFVVVTTTYPGAGPSEIETLISRPIEDEVSTLSGIKNIYSKNKEGISQVIAEFQLETDAKYAEQQVRDRVALARPKIPKEADEPLIIRVNPSDAPIAILSVASDLPEAQLYDLADQNIRPKIEQVPEVGRVDVIGGRKRELRVELDRNKLKAHEISASIVATQLQNAGNNIPAGKINENKSETVYRTIGEYSDIKQIDSTLINFLGNDVPVTISQVGKTVDTLEEEKSRVFTNGKQSIFLMVYRQSGANTVAVVDGVQKRIRQLNDEFKALHQPSEITMVHDGAKPIRANLEDVKESIFLGIILTFIVVYFFLGNLRSTLITGLALPYSLIGAFILMSAAGFTINLMTLLALSLTVGLVIDDAIVVRENIFRHTDLGYDPKQAALLGTKEVTLPVLATTLTVLAVFGPIAFLKGIVGQFFKEFGFTVCFAMLISLFDAFTMAPMLSAYYAGNVKREKEGSNFAVRAFTRLQDWLEGFYEKILRRIILKHPIATLSFALLIFLGSFAILKFVPKTFLPAQDIGEFEVEIDLPPGSNLQAMNDLGVKVDQIIRSNPEVATSVLIVGNSDGESNVAQFYIELVPTHQRKANTIVVKDRMREQLKPYAFAHPRVEDIDLVSGGERPFNLNIIGNNLDELEQFTNKVLERLKDHPSLKDVNLTNRPGKPEVQVKFNEPEASRRGISTVIAAQELRTQMEGIVPAKYRWNGREYDIRVRLEDDQRDLKKFFNVTYVPNINQRLVRLDQIATLQTATGPSTITRQNRSRYFQINADVNPDGPGLGQVSDDIKTMFETDLKPPPGITYKLVGQAENFQELTQSMMMAALLGVLFIYLIMSSLYESFITPFTLMLVLPLAACGAFYALALTRKSLDIFSMIGCIMLLGVAMKNSILLVDYTNQKMREGKSRFESLVEAGKVRLRPILMTTVALIAGMFPIALGLNEASRQRTSMGVAIIGGLISSTFLSLLVVPAAFIYVDRFKNWVRQKLSKTFWGMET